MAETILITGASGTIGSHTIAALEGKPGVTVRAGVRTPAKFNARANVAAVEFDYDKPETFEAALKGVDRVLLITPFVPNQVELAVRFIDAAHKAGVKHMVKLSAIGCENEPGIQLGRWHRATERNIEAAGIAHTFLRPNNFMENLLNYYPPQKDGAIYLPFGEGAVAWIDGRDIGDVAAKVLTDPIAEHAGKAYDLSGPEGLNMHQVAKAIGEVAGKPVRYVDVPEAAAKSAMEGMGAPDWMVGPMMELHAIDKAGYAAQPTATVQQLLGRPARPLAQFAQDHAAAFKKFVA